MTRTAPLIALQCKAKLLQLWNGIFNCHDLYNETEGFFHLIWLFSSIEGEKECGGTFFIPKDGNWVQHRNQNSIRMKWEGLCDSTKA